MSLTKGQIFRQWWTLLQIILPSQTQNKNFLRFKPCFYLLLSPNIRVYHQWSMVQVHCRRQWALVEICKYLLTSLPPSPTHGPSLPLKDTLHDLSWRLNRFPPSSPCEKVQICRKKTLNTMIPLLDVNFSDMQPCTLLDLQTKIFELEKHFLWLSWGVTRITGSWSLLSKLLAYLCIHFSIHSPIHCFFFMSFPAFAYWNIIANCHYCVPILILVQRLFWFKYTQTIQIVDHRLRFWLD